jgi:hypothetical protein
MVNMEPGRNPPRYQRKSVNYSGWIIAAIAALIVVAAIAYGMSDYSRTAGTGAPSPTTGQSNPAPRGPARSAVRGATSARGRTASLIEASRAAARMHDRNTGPTPSLERHEERASISSNQTFRAWRDGDLDSTRHLGRWDFRRDCRVPERGGRE